jgi:hypothetical protein
VGHLAGRLLVGLFALTLVAWASEGASVLAHAERDPSRAERLAALQPIAVERVTPSDRSRTTPKSLAGRILVAHRSATLRGLGVHAMASGISLVPPRSVRSPIASNLAGRAPPTSASF